MIIAENAIFPVFKSISCGSIEGAGRAELLDFGAACLANVTA
jgi:hypothetical protein